MSMILLLLFLKMRIESGKGWTQVGFKKEVECLNAIPGFLNSKAMLLVTTDLCPLSRPGCPGIHRHRMIHGGRKGICRPPEIIYNTIL